ncbi:hypothetical protein B0H10DRAFT_2241164 [Mycena sp. CBHHK59/15]|nr:hypothetical protein B0H10DRAFT_2241164 [Mycena sp. CBHHK59/15]
MPPTPQTLHAHGSPRGADDIVMVSPFVTPEKRVRESPNGSRSPGSLGVASPTDLAHDGGDPNKLEYWPPSPVLVSTDISMASPPRAVPPRAESAPAQPSPAKSRPIIESFALSRSPDVQPYFSTQSRHDLGVFNVSSQPSQILTPSDRDARRAFRQTVQSSFRLPLVKMGYRIHSFYGVLICVECGACRPPGDYVTHAKFHKLPSPSAADVIAITNLCGHHGVLDDPLAVVLPEFSLAPVEALKLHDGWFCTEHVVHYKDGAAHGAVQTFFSPVPRRYFHVVPELAGRSPHSLLSAYNAQYASLFSAPSSLIPQPTDSREVTPMECVTGWGKHLGEHICTRNKLRAVLTLTQLPAPSDRASHPLGRLYAIVYQYHQRVAAIHHEAHYRVRCALMDYPQEDARDFRCHTSPHTVSTYLHVLHSLAFALLYQFEPDVSTDYRFPLTAFETAEVRRYHQHLREAPGADPDDNINKFKSVLECFCALYLLRDDGSLKQPQDVTPVLARIKHVIRIAMLFEAWVRRVDFSGRLDLSITSVASRNLDVAVPSPFTRVNDYQRAISSITITYKDKTLHMASLRSGMSRAIAHSSHLLDDLLYGFSADIDVPADPIDDWSNTRQGYSFLHNHSWLPGDRPLIDHLLTRGPKGLAQVGLDGSFHLSAVAAQQFFAKDDAFIHHIMALLFSVSSFRGAEFTELRISNGFRSRGLLIHGSDLYLVGRRPKFEGHYLVVVQPAVIELMTILRGEEVASTYRQYLFVSAGSRIDHEGQSDQLSTLLTRFTEEYFGTALSLRPYCQVVVAIQRQFLNPRFLDDTDEDTYAFQAGHSTDTRRAHYAVTNLLPFLSSDLINNCKHASENWHWVLGLHPTLAPPIPLNKRRRFMHEAKPRDASNGDDSDGPPALDLTQLIAHITSLFADFRDDMRLQIGTLIVQAISEFIHRGALSVPSRERPFSPLPASSIPPTSSQSMSDMPPDDLAPPAPARQPFSPTSSDTFTAHRPSLLRAPSSPMWRVPLRMSNLYVLSPRILDLPSKIFSQIDQEMRDAGLPTCSSAPHVPAPRAVRTTMLSPTPAVSVTTPRQPASLLLASLAIALIVFSQFFPQAPVPHPAGWAAHIQSSSTSSAGNPSRPALPSAAAGPRPARRATLIQPSSTSTGNPSPPTLPEIMVARGALRRLLADPEADFRSEIQQTACIYALHSNFSFFVAAPTSSGKTLIFWLPAFVEDGMLTVVMVPNETLDACLLVNLKDSNQPNPTKC